MLNYYQNYNTKSYADCEEYELIKKANKLQYLSEMQNGKFYWFEYVLNQIETTDAQYGVLKIQNSPPPTGNVLSFANPAYEPSAAMPTYKVEDVLIRGKPSIKTSSVGFVALKSNYLITIHFL